MKTYYQKADLLCYCETPEERERAESTGWGRIPRRVAIIHCQEAGATILPLSYAEKGLDPEIENLKTWGINGKYLLLNGYIWEWKWGLNPPSKKP